MMKGKRATLGYLSLGVVLGGLSLVAAAGELRLTESDLLFGSSFESGHLPERDWNVSGNSPDVSSAEKRSGRYAVKSYLHRYQSATGHRTEVRAKAPAPVKGKDTWYGFSIYLPAPYPRDEVGETLVQWQATPDPGESYGNPPIALQVKDGRWVLRNNWNPTQPTIKSGQKQANYQLGTPETNKWTDWVFRIRWSYGSDGIIEVWKNGTRVLNKTGPNCYNDKTMPYFKMGIYKAKWRSKVGDVVERTVYHDEVRMAGHGSNYSDVAPR